VYERWSSFNEDCSVHFIAAAELAYIMFNSFSSVEEFDEYGSKLATARIRQIETLYNFRRYMKCNVWNNFTTEERLRKTESYWLLMRCDTIRCIGDQIPSYAINARLLESEK
jgi:hypothetical protein